MYIGHLPTRTANSAWRGIKVFADHAFIVSEALNHGMQVFDLQRRVDRDPLFASGSVAVKSIKQGLFVVSPRVTPRGLPAGLSVTIAGPGPAAPVDQDWTFVVRIPNDGPGGLSEVRAIESPPAGTRLMSAEFSKFGYSLRVRGPRTHALPDCC